MPLSPWPAEPCRAASAMSRAIVSASRSRMPAAAKASAMKPRRRSNSARRAPKSVRFLDPGGLDRLEDLFARALRVVVEAVERHDPVAQVDEVHPLRVHVGEFLRER